MSDVDVCVGRDAGIAGTLSGALLRLKLHRNAESVVIPESWQGPLSQTV